MEAVFAITSKMQLPEPLRERIHQYYDHFWREYEFLDGDIERFSKNLSHTLELELEVVLCKFMDLTMGIPFWVDCSPDFQKQLMLNLRVRVYMPDDYVIRRGEVDEEFYMISRGSVELATGSDSFERPVGGPDDDDADGGVELTSKVNGSSRRRYRVDEKEGGREQHAAKHLRQLSKDQAFGELALLMNYLRTADVRAITYVEMCVLNRRNFQETRIRRISIHAIARETHKLVRRADTWATESPRPLSNPVRGPALSRSSTTRGLCSAFDSGHFLLSQQFTYQVAKQILESQSKVRSVQRTYQ